MPLSGSLQGTAASHRADADVWNVSAPRVCACTQWVESRRGYDIKKPGSMDQDPIFRCASCGVLVDSWVVRPAVMGGRLSGSMGQGPSRRCAFPSSSEMGDGRPAVGGCLPAAAWRLRPRCA